MKVRRTEKQRSIGASNGLLVRAVRNTIGIIPSLNITQAEVRPAGRNSRQVAYGGGRSVG
jgi:adenosylmethionine-8-amino-7-oxononanoate aminotransferase